MGTFESTSARWTRIVQDHASSGLTVAAFCARRGLAVSTFYPWKRRLARGEDLPREAPAFVEARVISGDLRSGPVDLPTDGHGVMIAPVVGPIGRRVLVTPGFDPRLLLEVLGTLERAERTP